MSAKKGAAPGEATPNTTSTRTADSGIVTDAADMLRRRREASWRLPALDRGCRDPLGCHCHDEPESAEILDAARDAAGHLLALGYAPLLDINTIRALWRRHRKLAVTLARLAGAA